MKCIAAAKCANGKFLRVASLLRYGSDFKLEQRGISILKDPVAIYMFAFP